MKNTNSLYPESCWDPTVINLSVLCICSVQHHAVFDHHHSRALLNSKCLNNKHGFFEPSDKVVCVFLISVSNIQSR